MERARSEDAVHRQEEARARKEAGAAQPALIKDVSIAVQPIIGKTNALSLRNRTEQTLRQGRRPRRLKENQKSYATITGHGKTQR